MEGLGYDCFVCLNGKKIATATDYGDGAPVIVDEMDEEGMKTLKGYVAKLPPYEPRPEVGIDRAMEITWTLFIEELVNRDLALKHREKEMKRFKKFCQTEILFRLNTEAPGKWRSYKVRPDRIAEIKTLLDKNYGAGNYIILNEMMTSDPYAFEK
jgi:hypothetical protein